jgi:hypothetical protein
LDQFAAEPAPPAARVKASSVKPKLHVVKSDAPAILSAMAKGLIDPSVSAEKMRLMQDMYREAISDASRRAYTVAMNAVQASMTAIRANAVNSDFDSQYATYPALDAVLRPIYTAAGLTVGFTTEPSDLQRHQRVVIVLTHVDGHRETYRADFPSDGVEDGEQVQTLIHAAASAFTYAQRYLLCLAFNIAVAKDGDGNVVAPPAGPISASQLTTIANLIDRIGADEPALLEFLGVRDLAAIPSDKFDHAMWLVQNRKAA